MFREEINAPKHSISIVRCIQVSEMFKFEKKNVFQKMKYGVFCLPEVFLRVEMNQGPWRLTH